MSKVSKIIYQIGRLDTQMKPLTFEFEGERYENKDLTSLALKEHFGNGAKVILIYPVSLPFNRNLINEKSNFQPEFKEKIKWILDNKDEYFKNPREFFKAHPHTEKADDFILIHSIGEYESVKFEGTYNDIVLEIFFDMIERYLKDEFSELYIDISSGLNIYISALIEASRYFYLFSNLQNWNGKKVDLYLVFSEPITGSSSTLFRIFKEELEYKKFFFSPIKKEDIDDNIDDKYKLASIITDKILNESEETKIELKNRLQNCLENFAIHFSALKNATPLVHYTFELDKKARVIDLIEKIKDLVKGKLNGDWRKSPYLPKNELLKVILSLSLYVGIINLLDEIICNGQDVDLEKIKNKFESVYKKFGIELNNIFVENEIENLEKKIKKIKEENKWIGLDKILGHKKSSCKPRNFFAHTGFKSVLTEIKKCGDKIYIRYKEKFNEKEVKEIVKNYLKDVL